MKITRLVSSQSIKQQREKRKGGYEFFLHTDQIPLKPRCCIYYRGQNAKYSKHNTIFDVFSLMDSITSTYLIALVYVVWNLKK